MKFKQFLSEEKYKLKDVFDPIFQDCSEFLKESKGEPLFRGQNNTDHYIFSSRVYRKNKDISEMNSGLFNLYIEEKFKLKSFRNNHAVFATGWHNIVDMYGTPMFMFPCDGYKYLWSPTVKDFLSKGVGMRHALEDKLDIDVDGLSVILQLRDYADENDSNAFTVDEFKKLKIDVIYTGKKEKQSVNAWELIQPHINQFFDNAKYEMNDLPKAIKSHNEIIFKTEKYYAVPVEKVLVYYGSNKQHSKEKIDHVYSKFLKDIT